MRHFRQSDSLKHLVVSPYGFSYMGQSGVVYITTWSVSSLNSNMLLNTVSVLWITERRGDGHISIQLVNQEAIFIIISSKEVVILSGGPIEQTPRD